MPNEKSPPGAPAAQPKFGLGQVYATPAVLSHLAGAMVNPRDLLRRHQTGDWGEVDAEDQAANERALVEGTRILSVYVIRDRRIYAITEAEGDDGVRASTTLLFADEY